MISGWIRAFGWHTQYLSRAASERTYVRLPGGRQVSGTVVVTGMEMEEGMMRRRPAGVSGGDGVVVVVAMIGAGSGRSSASLSVSLPHRSIRSSPLPIWRALTYAGLVNHRGLVQVIVIVIVMRWTLIDDADAGKGEKSI